MRVTKEVCKLVVDKFPNSYYVMLERKYLSSYVFSTHTGDIYHCYRITKDHRIAVYKGCSAMELTSVAVINNEGIPVVRIVRDIKATAVSVFYHYKLKACDYAVLRDLRRVPELGKAFPDKQLQYSNKSLETITLFRDVEGIIKLDPHSVKINEMLEVQKIYVEDAKDNSPCFIFNDTLEMFAEPSKHRVIPHIPGGVE